MDADIRREVGQAIAHMRKARGLTQAKLGELIGSDASWVCRVEKGQAGLTLNTLRRFAEALDCTIRARLIPRPTQAPHV